MKGMIFAGCSFTWGQGLWYYSDLPNVPVNEIYIQDIYDRTIMSDASHLYKDTLRFPTLVANHYNTFAVTKAINGGSDEESLRFLDQSFRIREQEQPLTQYTFDFGEIDYIIYQTTQPFRSGLRFKYLDTNYIVYLTPDLKNYDRLYKIDPDNDIFKDGEELDIQIFFDWMSLNKINFTDVETILLEQLAQDIERKLKFYEGNGIKTKLMVWTPEYLPFIFQNKWLSERLINLKYKKQSFDCIQSLQLFDDQLMIENDQNKKMTSGNDLHPSKKCHEIIAQSIIEKINNE